MGNPPSLSEYIHVGDLFFQLLPGILLAIFDIVFVIYWLIGARKIVSRKGDIRRGHKLWSKPLPPDRLSYLKTLPNGIIEIPEEQTFLVSRRAPLLFVKSNDEIMIAGGEQTKSTVFSFSNHVSMAIVVGYVATWLPEPVLEFRIPLKREWILIFMILNILYINNIFWVLGLIIVLIRSITGIEHFLRNKLTK